MEYRIDIRPIEVIVLDALQEIILMLIVNEFQASEIFIVLPVLQIIHDQDVRTSAAIQFLYDVAADESGTTCYNNHDISSP